MQLVFFFVSQLVDLLWCTGLVTTLTSDKVKWLKSTNTLKHTTHYQTSLQELALLLQRRTSTDFFIYFYLWPEMLLLKRQSKRPLPETVHIKIIKTQSAGRSHSEHVIKMVVWHSQSEHKTSLCCLHEGICKQHSGSYGRVIIHRSTTHWGVWIITCLRFLFQTSTGSLSTCWGNLKDFNKSLRHSVLVSGITGYSFHVKLSPFKLSVSFCFS